MSFLLEVDGDGHLLGGVADTHLLSTKRSSEFADIVGCEKSCRPQFLLWHGCQGPRLQGLWRLECALGAYSFSDLVQWEFSAGNEREP